MEAADKGKSALSEHAHGFAVEEHRHISSIKRRFFVALMPLLLCIFEGCGPTTPDKIYTPSDTAGKLDPSLPDNIKLRQEAIYRTFEVIRTGVHLSDLSRYEKDIDFRDSEKQFFSGGVRLVKWNWSRSPKNDSFGVVLTFQKDEPGMLTFDTERTYIVHRSGRMFVIRQQ